ncbi:hypothetical protein ERJ62_09965, partial [Lactobacillus helveticus]|nr:hypothetical protein [Lactobacillus helveticus]
QPHLSTRQDGVLRYFSFGRIAFMMMNLSKYWNRRWSKDQFSLFKNKNREKKRPIKLKLRVELIVFRYLRVGYFPDTFIL